MGSVTALVPKIDRADQAVALLADGRAFLRKATTLEEVRHVEAIAFALQEYYRRCMPLDLAAAEALSVELQAHWPRLKTARISKASGRLQHPTAAEGGRIAA